MRSNAKKFSLLLVVVLMLTTILAACGGGTNTPNTGTNGNTEGTNGNTGNTPATTDANAGGAANAPASESRFVFDATKLGNILYEAEDPSMAPAAAVSRTDTLIIGTEPPSGQFFPPYSTTTYDNRIMNLIFGEGGKTTDGVYEHSWTDLENSYISDDGLTMHYKLKEGITYSDGTPVTMKDYEFGFKLMFDPSYNGDSDYSRFKLVGGQDYTDGKTPDIAGIKVLNDLEVEVQVEVKNARSFDIFAPDVLYNSAYYGADYSFGNTDGVKALLDKPIGAGPYVLKDWQPGQQATLEANPNYFLGAPKIKNVIFKVVNQEVAVAAMTAGDIDIYDFSVDQDKIDEITALGYIDFFVYPTNGYGYIGMNNSLPKFADEKVRQALAYGLDRQKIVELYYGDFARVLNIPESDQSWAYTDEGIEAYEFDQARALELFAEAGWVPNAAGKLEKDGEVFSIDFAATNPNELLDALIPVLKENYEALGIELVVEQLDFNTIIEKQNKGDFEMFFMAWGTGVDPDNDIYVTGGGQNKLGYSNPVVDDAYMNGLQELDIEKRKEIYKTAYQEINRTLPAIFVYQRSDGWAVSSRVKGFVASPFREFTTDLYKYEIITPE
jgi:peptide/nickel transport system substrate-binding protein